MITDIFYYHEECGGNFGDYINKIFFEKLTQKTIYFLRHPTSLHYVCTGSIMTQVTSNSIIWGTGFISENSDVGGYYFGQNNIVIEKPYSI